MTSRFASSSLLNDLCGYLNRDNDDRSSFIITQMIATCDITTYSENISFADANRRETVGNRSIVFENDQYKLKFTKTYTQNNYPPRTYYYYFSSGHFSYYKEDNYNVGAMELNENDKTFRYVPRLENNFIEANIN